MSVGSKVVLFSPYSPDIGGGGTNLRTLRPGLASVQVEWLYTAPTVARERGTVRVAPPIVGGTPLHDLSRMVVLWAGGRTRTFNKVIDAITSRGASRYWVVGHNEGILVARVLALGGARVHLTIQDDVPDGVFARARRYRALSRVVRPVFDATLRRMVSLDVTSDGMQRYYRERIGLESVVVHPFVAALPEAPAAPPLTQELRVGHLGSIYAIDELRATLRALRTVAAERGTRARMVMIGLAPRYRSIADEFPELVELVSDLPEDRAIERLFSCHFLYAMYPFDSRSDVFRRTSLPTKLSSYIKCQRPILAHSPSGSTLLELIERYRLGVGCTAPSSDAVAVAMRRILESRVAPSAYETVRDEVYGLENARRLGACLEAL